MQTKNKLFFFFLLATAICCSKDNGKDHYNLPDQSSTVKDRDGNIYKTIAIGTQEWMAENLKVYHYQNGDDIPMEPDAQQWISLQIGCFCHYDNNLINADVYGRLYNAIVVNDNRNVCPDGWHVPTSTEWDMLENHLGGSNVSGGKMRESDNEFWLTTDPVCNNSSEFTALPAGFRNSEQGTYIGLSSVAAWWTATKTSGPSGTQDYRSIIESSTELISNSNPQNVGLSIRCVKN